MKMFLTAFGLHNPFAGPKLQSHSLIPIANDAIDGLDLDYSSLLIAESFLIDETAYEYVRENRRSFLRPMYRSLEILRNEGFLEIVNYSEPLLEHSEQIVAKTESLLEAVEVWRHIARNQWLNVKEEFAEFGTTYSPSGYELFDSAHYGVVSYLERRDGKIDPKETARLHRLIESRRRRITSNEEEEVVEILKPLVAQVVMNDLLRRWFDLPFLDWDDAQNFHDRLHVAQWQEFDSSGIPSNRIAEQSRHLFQVIIPELLPDQIEGVIKFLNNKKAVQSLRNELWESLAAGEKVSKDWALKLHQEALRSQIRSDSRSRMIKWIGRAADLLIPGIGTIGEVAIMTAEDTVESFSNSSWKKKYEWLYVLQKIKLV